MKLVRAAFGDYLNLRARPAPVFRGIGIGENGDFLDRFLVRGNHRRAAVLQAVYADTVDREIVGVLPLSVGHDLHRVFNLKNRRV